MRYRFTRFAGNFRPGDILPEVHDYQDHHVEKWIIKGTLVPVDTPEPEKRTQKKKAASKKA